MGLIDKEKVVVEIERRIAFFSDINNKQVVKSNLDCAIAFAGLRDFFDSLEVKEVDLDESARHYLLHEHISPLNEVLHQADLRVEMQYHTDIEDAYKAGFELGIKTKGNKKLEE